MDLQTWSGESIQLNYEPNNTVSLNQLIAENTHTWNLSTTNIQFMIQSIIAISIFEQSIIEFMIVQFSVYY